MGGGHVWVYVGGGGDNQRQEGESAELWPVATLTTGDNRKASDSLEIIPNRHKQQASHLVCQDVGPVCSSGPLSRSVGCLKGEWCEVLDSRCLVSLSSSHGSRTTYFVCWWRLLLAVAVSDFPGGQPSYYHFVLITSVHFLFLQ